MPIKRDINNIVSIIRRCLKAESEHVQRWLFRTIPYLEALTSTRWAQDYELLSWLEFYRLDVVMEFINFSNINVGYYVLQEDHRLVFSLACLADLLGLDRLVICHGRQAGCLCAADNEHLCN